MNGLLALALAVPAAAAGQERESLPAMTESAAAAALMADRDSPDIWRAIGLAVDLGPRAGQELRAAVIDAAWTEARGGGSGDPDRMFLLFEAAEGFRDPRAIPLMIEALKYGGGVKDALADLGAAAFPATLAAVSDPSGHWSRIGAGLDALRFMTEDGALGPRQLGQVREAVRERLSGPSQGAVGSGSSFVVNAALQLAVALGDPELRRIVERIATDRAFVGELIPDSGTDEWQLDEVQETARSLLSGASLPPHRRPLR
ncbi:hypothetical protein [Candidatus Palauibacter sp.]|uniref:hypothetical protein n=1 Tax=Candidatus Palauibacter sp. TaxID=3101350 RepID=UPI003B516A01